MRLAISGSINIALQILIKYISEDITEIVTDSNTLKFIRIKECAEQLNIIHTIFTPQYNLYKENSVFFNNNRIAEYSDYAIIFWDGKSQEIKHLIDCFKNMNKTVYIIRRKKQG